MKVMVDKYQTNFAKKLMPHAMDGDGVIISKIQSCEKIAKYPDLHKKVHGMWVEDGVQVPKIFLFLGIA